MRRRISWFGAGLVVVALAGCGGGDSPTGTRMATIRQSVTPNPVVAELSTDGTWQYSAAFTITFTESNGVGVTVAALSTSLYDSTGTVMDAAHSQVTATYPSTRLEANGSLPIAFNVSYTQPGGGRGAVLRVTATFTDDQGSAYPGTMSVDIF